jgi:predicted RNA-binding Zn-ribbon protein involved in translation (DUF1610 family)
MKYEVIIYEFECLGCGKEGTSTYKVNIPCPDCGEEYVYKMIIPQGTDELREPME